MDEAQFWSIIESGGPEIIDDDDRRLAAIRERLSQLPPPEIIDFDRLFDRKMADAYRWDLWGAAYMINGGCSDDGFCYFRAWLISRGRAVYSAALENPDSLAGLTDPECDAYEFEELWYVPRQVYEERTGEEMPAAESLEPAEPIGEDWDFDDDEQVSRRLPKLAGLYL